MMSTTSSRPTVNAASSAFSWLSPMPVKRSWRSGATFDQVGPCENPSKLVVPIRTHNNATVPGTAFNDGRPLSKGRVRRTAGVEMERRHPAEEPEDDPERIGAVTPDLHAVQTHADELDRRVDEHHRRQLAGVAAVGVDELDPGEGQDPDRRGPAAQALGIGQRLGW